MSMSQSTIIRCSCGSIGETTRAVGKLGNHGVREFCFNTDFADSTITSHHALLEPHVSWARFLRLWMRMSDADLERLSSRTRRHGCGKLCTPRTRKRGAIRGGRSVGMAIDSGKEPQSARGEGKKERSGRRSEGGMLDE